MAKDGPRIKIKLDTAGTGFFYASTKNRRTTTKLELKKNDPIIRKHVVFKEGKL